MTPTPKLTPLPSKHYSPHYTYLVMQWLSNNKDALESIIAQQENTVEQHNVNDAPTRREVDRLKKRNDNTDISLDRIDSELSEIRERLDALEYYYAQQEQPMQSPDNVNTTPTYADIEALKADLIARINQADRDHRALIDHQRERIDGFCGSIERLELKIARMGGIITGTKDYVDEQIRMFVEAISRNEENLCRLQLNTKDNTQRLTALESRPHAETQTVQESIGMMTFGPLPESEPQVGPHIVDGYMMGVAGNETKPNCERCGDKKIIGVRRPMLCPCVKVGDVVTAEVANLLPEGSRVWWGGWRTFIGWKDGEWYWEKHDGEWHGTGLCKPPLKEIVSNNWTILRIGPATVTMYADGKPLEQPLKSPVVVQSYDPHTNTAQVTPVADDAKPLEMRINTRGCSEPLDSKTVGVLAELCDATIVKPDKAEEIARECFPDFGPEA